MDERLTSRTHSGSPDIMFSNFPTPKDLMVGYAKVYSRLCAYEDIGTPEELAALVALSTPKECGEEVINRGMDVSGEYDIDANLLCPSCGAVVGDAEYNELNGEFCHKCGQKLALPEAPKEGQG